MDTSKTSHAEQLTARIEQLRTSIVARSEPYATIYRSVVEEIKQTSSDGNSSDDKVEQTFKKLSWLGDQARVHEQLGVWMTMLGDAWEPLLREQCPRVKSFRNFTRRLVISAKDAYTVGELLPAAVIQFPEEHQYHAVTYTAVVGGLLSAWYESHYVRLERDVEHTTAAMLLRDIGLCQLPPAKLPHVSTAEHVPLSSAIVCGMPETSIDVVLAVGRHHERMDGTGSPSGITGERLTRTDRVVTLLTSLMELWRDESEVLTPEVTVEQLQAALPNALHQLYQKARQAEFDMTLTANLICSCGYAVPEGEGILEKRPLMFGLTKLGQRRLRVDPPEPIAEGAGPHFLAAQSQTARQSSTTEQPKSSKPADRAGATT
ncbi:HD domain-containing phosphohydrolase [Calycomorphotria hydatis]|uniref:Cyclic di-GMP phosphodiesterase response regulator RpfG n=1 Tax=Calycomorphotria hydatis TaxID=2528027 RepID=A0A517T880_9PLAN|nr:HD domain-containing phosphohydrolase [Calycomorphotria hydatis]QDT64571.1 hypothetical protein V22_18060 [Calycomorphotria hydatis]